jgi:hypothetical protein
MWSARRFGWSSIQVIRCLASLLALTLGSVGLLACMVGIFGVWLIKSRLDQANETVTVGLDKGLTSIQDRVRDAQRRIQDSKITASTMSQQLRDWSVEKAKERIVTQLDIEAQTNKLAGQLQSADALLKSSTELFQGGREILVIANQLGASVDPVFLDSALAKLDDARSKLQEVEGSVSEVSQLAAVRDDKSEQTRLNRTLKLVTRTLVTIGEIDTRLDQTVTGLSELQTEAQLLSARISNFILFVAVVACLLLLWVAAGQAALCVVMRRRWYQSRSSLFDSNP